MKDVKRFIRNGDFVATPEGVLIHGCILARGHYVSTINGRDEQHGYNLVPTEGITYFLGVALLPAVAKQANWFLAPYSGNVDPAANWNAANFATLASEIVSATEGFSNVTRPAWTPDGAGVVAGVVGNLAAKAIFNIVCTTNVNIAGAGMLSNNTRGGTGGTLVSAIRFPSVRSVYNGDAFELGYEVELQDS